MTKPEAERASSFGLRTSFGFRVSSFGFPMHALVIAIGSHGDVHPMLGIAGTLVDRGHRVTFVTSGYFEGLVRRAGLDDFVPLGTADEFRESLANPDLWHPLRAFKVVFVDYVLPWTRQLYDIVTEHAT